MNIAGKIILITGDAGSFGRWITKEFPKRNPKEIRIYSYDEQNQVDMYQEFPGSRVRFTIGNFRGYNRLLKAIQNAQLL